MIVVDLDDRNPSFLAALLELSDKLCELRQLPQQFFILQEVQIVDDVYQQQCNLGASSLLLVRGVLFWRVLAMR